MSVVSAESSSHTARGRRGTARWDQGVDREGWARWDQGVGREGWARLPDRVRWRGGAGFGCWAVAGKLG